MINIKVLASSSRGNAYYVTDGKTPLLLECGIKYQDIRKALNFKTSNIAGCLLSHEHKDHSKAIEEVIKAGIDVYTSWGTVDVLGVTSHRINLIENKQQFEIGTWTILPFETQHDAADPIGFILQNQAGDKLLFATDTYYIRYRFNGLTHIMIEANYSIGILNENIAKGVIPKEMKKRLLKSHFSIENVKEFFKANDLSKVQEIYLLHLSDNNSDADDFKREIAELTGKMVHVAMS